MMEYCEGRKECGDGKAYAEDMRELEASKEEWDGIFSLYDALHGCGEPAGRGGGWRCRLM